MLNEYYEKTFHIPGVTDSILRVSKPVGLINLKSNRIFHADITCIKHLKRIACDYPHAHIGFNRLYFFFFGQRGYTDRFTTFVISKGPRPLIHIDGILLHSKVHISDVKQFLSRFHFVSMQ